MSLQADDREAVAADGHRWTLLGRRPERPRAQLLWLPALGVSARNYLPLAEALAARGVATWVHEWRGNGGSSLRPSRDCDWGYRELLSLDLPASLAVLGEGGPRTIGGHSLGGQLACCFAGQHPQAIDGLCLVASGTPYWRSFPGPRGWLLPAVYRFLPWLARRRGVLPGRRLGFGGTEARPDRRLGPGRPQQPLPRRRLRRGPGSGHGARACTGLRGGTGVGLAGTVHFDGCPAGQAATCAGPGRAA